MPCDPAASEVDLEINFGPDYFWNYVACEETDIEATPIVQGLSLIEQFAEEEPEPEPEEEASTLENISSGDQCREVLYPGASVNVWESLASILAFVQSEHISGSGLGRLLSLIDLHLPQPNNFFKSKHTVFKMFENLKDPIEVHYFCSICYKTCMSVTDLCDLCKDETRTVEYFLTFPLAPQVRKMFERPVFVQNLRYNQTRVKTNQSNIEDIFDGQAYQAAESQGRTTRIWGSTVKPYSNVYLLPIYKDLDTLRKGIDVKCHGESEMQKVKCSVLCGTCDAPATAAFLNIKTHSGFYSCPICITKGSKPGDTTVFPFEDAPLRNMVDYKEQVKLAVGNQMILQKTIRNEERFCGIRGPTILSELVDDIFSSMAIDPMHCLYLGVMRQMLKIWFVDGKYQDKAKLLTQKLLQLTPPEYLHRAPQAIEKLVHWKATEFRSFLFNLSMVLLQDLLESRDFDHFSLFVKGVALLYTSSISQDDLRESEMLLTRFVREFQNLYTVDSMSHNLHMCLHLTHCVKLLGPLWSVSCFNFEDINGRILNLLHGTRHMGLQIHSNIGIITQLPITIHNLKDGPVKDFCKNIKGRYRMNISEVISSGLHCVGNFSDLSVENAWVAGTLQREIPVNPSSTFKLFHRLLKHRLLFVSSSYRRGGRVSSYVSYNRNCVVKYGNILYFVKLICNCSHYCMCSPKFFAIVKPVPVTPCKTNVVVFNHLFKCDTSDQEESFFNTDVVAVHDLQFVLFKIEHAGSTYLAAPLNNLELE
ncbi:RNA-directed RNA polymerase [Frankliniella fusca]|uniref:RNA-directed RNA polymerase n=1 Tax=Frankliniella fusca TaxID=407009 RepID=A0AAE1I4D5_9NEOP|nr:RNA-directed RNA polymerase [Frankliniella fusca]